MGHHRRSILAFTVAAAALLCTLSATAQAAELVLFERAGCVWCDRWNSEVGPVYDRTAEGRIAPLRRVHVDRMRPPEAALASPVIYTPTFVLIDNGKEIGRITGYSGEAQFWGLLGRIIPARKPPTDAGRAAQPSAKGPTWVPVTSGRSS